MAPVWVETLTVNQANEWLKSTGMLWSLVVSVVGVIGAMVLAYAQVEENEKDIRVQTLILKDHISVDNEVRVDVESIKKDVHYTKEAVNKIQRTQESNGKKVIELTNQNIKTQSTVERNKEVLAELKGGQESQRRILEQILRSLPSTSP